MSNGSLQGAFYFVGIRTMSHFQCIEPNDETRAAIDEAERGELITVGSLVELMADLSEDDYPEESV